MKHAPKGPVKQDPMRPEHPMRGPCSAHSKQTGKPCRQPAIPGGTVCYYHGGAAPQVEFKAQERLKALQPKAITTLETLLNRSEFPTVQMAAVRDVLDRTEGKPVETQNVTVTATVSVVDILKQRHARHARPESD